MDCEDCVCGHVAMWAVSVAVEAVSVAMEAHQLLCRPRASVRTPGPLLRGL